jgi:hypothetical protein
MRQKYKPSTQPTIQPTISVVPGVTLSYTGSMDLAEDGSKSCSFHISLQTTPLSSVLVSVSSEYKLLSIYPSSITFDSMNYETPVEVHVLGIEDNVDRGTHYKDYVRFSFVSSDSLSSCENSGRLNCALAAMYDRYRLNPLNVTIADNDIAGVLLDETTVFASFNNFGDSLKTGSFRFKLATEPLSNITVSIVGLGQYSIVYPKEMAIEPRNWQTTHVFSIESTAPSDRRPICTDGGRYCDAAADRFELFNLNLLTDDVIYAGISEPQLALNVSVMHDITDPPALLFATFNDVLNSIIVAFDQSTGNTGLSGSFSCDKIFELNEQEVTRYFGVGSTCAFTSRRVETYAANKRRLGTIKAAPTTIQSAAAIRITFGHNAQILVGDRLKLLDLKIQSAYASASLFTTNQSVVIGQPINPTKPVASLVVSSARLSVCSDLLLDASASSGSGGRALKYNFTVSPLSIGIQLQNITSALEAANLNNLGEGSFKVQIPSPFIPKASHFVVSLQATNFLGLSDHTSKLITTLNTLAPLLNIQGSNPQFVTRSASFRLVATATLPAVSCVASTLPNSKMTFLWSEISGKYAGALSGTSKNPKMLIIPANSLTAGESYSFRVTCLLTDSPEINNTAVVDVHVSYQDLIAHIEGGAVRQAGIEVSFVIDGSLSSDPDEARGGLSYSWSCDGPDVDSCAKLTIPTYNATLVVSAGILPLGQYTFTLIVMKGWRNATASSVINVVAGSPPTIYILPLSQSKYSHDDGFVQVGSRVVSKLLSTTEWSVSSSDVASPFVVDGYFASKTVSLYSIICVASLTLGNTYSVQLSATDSAGSKSYSTIELSMNQPPSSGSVLVFPTFGFALDTSFSFTAPQWVDNDLPLYYSFGTFSVESSLAVGTALLSPFGYKSLNSGLSGVVLSQGVSTSNYMVLVGSCSYLLFVLNCSCNCPMITFFSQGWLLRQSIRLLRCFWYCLHHLQRFSNCAELGSTIKYFSRENNKRFREWRRRFC